MDRHGYPDGRLRDPSGHLDAMAVDQAGEGPIAGGVGPEPQVTKSPSATSTGRAGWSTR
jgi:hypothetical protein